MEQEAAPTAVPPVEVEVQKVVPTAVATAALAQKAAPIVAVPLVGGAVPVQEAVPIVAVLPVRCALADRVVPTAAMVRKADPTAVATVAPAPTAVPPVEVAKALHGSIVTATVAPAPIAAATSGSIV